MTFAFYLVVQFPHFVSFHTCCCMVYGIGLLTLVVLYCPIYRHDALFWNFSYLELLSVTNLIESALWMWFLFSCYLIPSLSLHYRAFIIWSLIKDDNFCYIILRIGVTNFFFNKARLPLYLFPSCELVLLSHYFLVAPISMCHQFLRRHKNCLSICPQLDILVTHVVHMVII